MAVTLPIAFEQLVATHPKISVQQSKHRHFIFIVTVFVSGTHFSFSLIPAFLALLYIAFGFTSLLYDQQLTHQVQRATSRIKPYTLDRPASGPSIIASTL
jgi:hypothetical protein